MSAIEEDRSRLRLPAFGRELIRLREDGQVPVRGFGNAHVIVSLDTWRFGRHPNTWRLVIDSRDDPSQLDFCGVAGLDVLLAVDSRISDMTRRDAAARAILRSDPASLIELDAQAPHVARFIKTRAVGVELAEFA